MITRADYMAGRATHEQYYRSVCCTAGIDFRGHSILPRVRECLAAGDEHLNRIQMSLPFWHNPRKHATPFFTWDGWGAHPLVKAALTRAFKAHGDEWTLAGSVCALKQAARDAVAAEGGAS